MMKTISIALTFLLCWFTQAAYAEETSQGNTKIESLNKATWTLERKVYHNHRVTFYCEAEFTRDKKISDRNGYRPIKDNESANRIDWEHVVPVNVFGKSFEEWRKGHPDCLNSKGKPYYGPHCARKTSIQFRYMESDMYNLVPAIGEIKRLKSNYSYAEIPYELREFGTCDFEIEDRKAEPRPEIRGDIARTYFYMDWAYPDRGIISDKNKEMFEAWNEEDPVGYWECRRAKRIERLQGNVNPYVKQPCKKSSKWW